MPTLTISRGMLLSLGLVATLSMAACTATKPPDSAGPGNSHTVAPASSFTPIHAASPPAGASSTTPPEAPNTTPPEAPSTTPAGQGGVENLVIGSAVRSELTAAFAAVKGVSASDVAGTYPGSVYYAFDPAAGTYWALAEFVPSGTASLAVAVSFQDGGSDVMFRKVGAGPWQARIVGSVPTICYEVKFFPPTVLMTWSMPTSVPTGMAGCH